MGVNNIKTTIVFEKLMESKNRISIFQGSSRASKTYNIIIYWVYKLLNEPDKILTIVRKTGPALKGSVLRDLKEILIKFDIYKPENWRVVDGMYIMPNGSIIEWFAVDDEAKLRGRTRDYLFINEATEVSYDEFQQLILRTREKIVLDFNPSLYESYLYDLEERDDADFHIVTYKDNPFLPAEQVAEIERLKDTDENLWKVFGLGQRGNPETLVFPRFELYEDLPYNAEFVGRGMDFGYHDPTTLIEVWKTDDSIYLKELIYARGYTIPDLLFQFEHIGIGRWEYIWCDSSEPMLIAELKRGGYHPKPVKKQTILSGLEKMRRHRIFIHNESDNMIKEFKSYAWRKDRDGNLVDVPEDRNNHAIDAARYVLDMVLHKRQGKIKVL
jgi:phage terminase large subunit